MKYLQRYLSLLVALALSVGLFSIPAHAEEYKDYIFDSSIIHNDGEHHQGEQIDKGFSGNVTFTDSVTMYMLNHSAYWMVSLWAYRDDNTLISLADDKIELSLTGISISTDYTKYLSNNEQLVGTKKWSSVSYDVILLHDDGTTTTLNDSDFDVSYSSGTEKLTITGSYKVSKPVSKIRFKLWISPTVKYGMELNVKYKFDTIFKGSPILLITNVEDKQVGLLEGIWGGITDLGGKITSGFTELGGKLVTGFENVTNGVKDVWKTCEAGFANMVKGITDLPGKIWEFFENGLKNLLVPSDEDMIAYKDRWDELLASRLGAVYQVTDILHNSWDEVMSADEINTISIPSATLNLPDNATFTFGGYEVEIVPEGFDFLVTSIKIIVGIVCSIAFINGMRKRYDEVMGVET